MGYDTHFHGMLEFSRPMTAPELVWIEQVLKAGHDWTPKNQRRSLGEGRQTGQGYNRRA